MRTHHWIVSAFLLVQLGLALPGAAEPLGTAFTYQGRLDQLGVPAVTTCQFLFGLWDAALDGNLISGPVAVADVVLTDGTFTTLLDFGAGVFDGQARWLEIAVSCEGDPDYTLLEPRQRLTPGPYAMYAEAGPTGGGGPWTLSTYGIQYQGHVAVGTIAHPGIQLRVDVGTEDVNPVWITSNNENYAALAVQNDAIGGIGIYDAASDRHYLSGKLGVGTLSPVGLVDVIGEGQAVRGESTGGGLTGTTRAGVHGVGSGNFLTGYAVGVLASASNRNGLEAYTESASSVAGYFENLGGGNALWANGPARVRTLEIVGGADLVEGFTTGDENPAPGTVVVIDPVRAGALRASREPYDRRVAGVVSGAGGLDSGLRLGHAGVMDGDTPVAMAGRVYALCSAENGPISPGDLLTTASIPGHAMRAVDAPRSQGAVLGKAMGSLALGTGLVLVLVNLQ